MAKQEKEKTKRNFEKNKSKDVVLNIKKQPKEPEK